MVDPGHSSSPAVLILSREDSQNAVGGVGVLTESVAFGLARCGWAVTVVVGADGDDRQIMFADGSATFVHAQRVGGYATTTGLATENIRGHMAMYRAATTAMAGQPIGLILLTDIFSYPEGKALSNSLRVPLAVILSQDFATLLGDGRAALEVTTGVRADGSTLTRLERTVAEKSDHLVFVSRSLEASFTASYAGVAAKVATVLLGVDVHELDASFRPDVVEHVRQRILERAVSLRGGRPVGALLVAAGRLVPEKGFEQLIRACHLPGIAERNVHLVLAGTGPLARHLEAHTRALPTGVSVDLVGAIERPSLLSMFAAADLNVVPSLWESFCYVCAEMMASGRPVLATDSDSLSELIPSDLYGYRLRTSGVSGKRTFATKDMAGLIVKALTDSCAIGRARSARRRILERYTSEHFSGALDRVCRAAAAGREGS